jgi:hypothetical protein
MDLAKKSKQNGSNKLKGAIQEEWNNLTEQDIQRKIDQEEMETRIFDVIYARGKLRKRNVLIFFKK